MVVQCETQKRFIVILHYIHPFVHTITRQPMRGSSQLVGGVRVRCLAQARDFRFKEPGIELVTFWLPINPFGLLRHDVCLIRDHSSAHMQNMHTCTVTHTHTHAHTHTRTHTHTHTRTHAYIKAHTCMHVSTNSQTHIHQKTHTYTHTHTHRHSCDPHTRSMVAKNPIVYLTY